MRKKIGTIDTEAGRMGIYYNGPGVEMTGEYEDGSLVEALEYTPGDFEEAVDAAYQMYHCWPWNLELEEEI